MTDSFKVEGTLKLHKIETEIPNLKGEPEMSKRRLILAVDENQLWSIFIGLDRNKNLIPVLKVANSKLATEIHRLGEKEYKWCK